MYPIEFVGYSVQPYIVPISLLCLFTYLTMSSSSKFSFRHLFISSSILLSLLPPANYHFIINLTTKTENIQFGLTLTEQESSRDRTVSIRHVIYILFRRWFNIHNIIAGSLLSSHSLTTFSPSLCIQVTRLISSVDSIILLINQIPCAALLSNQRCAPIVFVNQPQLLNVQ